MSTQFEFGHLAEEILEIHLRDVKVGPIVRPEEWRHGRKKL
jgi:hypothetical protein